MPDQDAAAAMLAKYRARASNPAMHVAMPVRTDGRTYGEPPHLPAESSASVTRGRTYGMSSWGESLEEWVDALEVGMERGPVLRQGQRAEIPGWIRYAIHARDSWRCQWCASHFPGFESFTEKFHLELDHIVPWSAGGSDRSDNLRSLCNGCNTRRGNRLTDAYIRMVPVGWCDYCARSRSTHEPVLVFCGKCEMTRPATALGRVA